MFMIVPVPVWTSRAAESLNEYLFQVLTKSAPTENVRKEVYRVVQRPYLTEDGKQFCLIGTGKVQL